MMMNWLFLAALWLTGMGIGFYFGVQHGVSPAADSSRLIGWGSLPAGCDHPGRGYRITEGGVECFQPIAVHENQCTPDAASLTISADGWTRGAVPVEWYSSTHLDTWDLDYRDGVLWSRPPDWWREKYGSSVTAPASASPSAPSGD